MTENAPASRFEALLVIILVLLIGGGAIFLLSGCYAEIPYVADV